MGRTVSPRRWWLVATVVTVMGCCGGGYAYLNRDRTPLHDADVTGTWCSADRGEFVFGADHTFTARDLLAVVLSPAVQDSRRSAGPSGRSDRPSGRSDGAGTWQLAPALSDPHGPATEVDLSFRTLNSKPAAHGHQLISVVRNERLMLLFTVGDPDNGAEYQFLRSTSPCP